MLKQITLATALTGVLASTSYAQTTIKVGVVTPLSGTYAPIGKQVRWGAELAVKQINAAGGVNGRKFELLFEDEEANPPVAVRKAEKLLQQDKADLLTGTVNSGSTLAVRQLDHWRAVQPERVSGQRQRVPAIGRADRLAHQERAGQEIFLRRA